MISDLALSEIVMHIGYESEAAFNAFKHKFSMSPSTDVVAVVLLSSLAYHMVVLQKCEWCSKLRSYFCENDRGVIVKTRRL